MNLNAFSIFDLSSSEKLQLVEDLWDDLAVTSSEVIVHEWQKEELVRRKANLMSNPASGLSWDEVKRRVRSRLFFIFCFCHFLFLALRHFFLLQYSCFFILLCFFQPEKDRPL